MVPLNTSVDVLDDTLGCECPPAFDILEYARCIATTAGSVPKHGAVVGRCDTSEAAAPAIDVNLTDNWLNAPPLVNIPDTLVGTIGVEDNLPFFVDIQVGDDGNRYARLLGAGLGSAYGLLSDGGVADDLVGLLDGEAGDVHGDLLLPS